MDGYTSLLTLFSLQCQCMILLYTGPTLAFHFFAQAISNNLIVLCVLFELMLENIIFSVKRPEGR